MRRARARWSPCRARRTRRWRAAGRAGRRAACGPRVIRLGPDGLQEPLQERPAHLPPAAGTLRRVTSITRRVGSVLAAAGCALAGCGDSGEDYANKPRPATPINLTASISDKEISISPNEFGAGAVVIIVSNQTSGNQRVTLQTEEIGGKQPGTKQSTDPIAPR